MDNLQKTDSEPHGVKRGMWEQIRRYIPPMAQLGIAVFGIGWAMTGFQNLPIAVLVMGSGAALFAWSELHAVPEDTWVFRYRNAIGAFVACILFGAATGMAGYLYQEPIDNPEDARNKYVCVTQIPHPIEGKGKYATLIEFGAIFQESEGTNFAISCDQDIAYRIEWSGLPHRTDKQEEVGAMIGGSEFGPHELKISDMLYKITPNQSYYVYIETDTPFVPKEIEYYAIRTNWFLPENVRSSIGKSYSGCPL